MLGVTKMTMWRGKPIATLRGYDLEAFRKDMQQMGQRRAFAPAMVDQPDTTKPGAQTNLRGK